MRSSSQICGREFLMRLAAVGLLSGAVAGCSADATRFSADGGAPGTYGAQPAPEVTGSLATGQVVSRQLPPPGQAVGPYSQAPAPYGAPSAYGAPASYAASGASQPLYGSPAYNASRPPAYGAAPGQGTHVVEAGETLGSIAGQYGLSSAQLGAANRIPPGMTVRTGQTLVIPPRASYAQAPAQPQGGARTASAAPVTSSPAALPPQRPTPKASPVKGEAQKATPPAAAPTKVAAATPTPAVQKSAAPAADTKAASATVAAAASDADNMPRTLGTGPQFRAPVRGRVISTFGPKPGGTHNDGVNFAVPEGTDVRAAEDGVVAYAGDELKGYGNLVLIKHSDGYVTAYAHASEIDVKKGDKVRRGQVIAKAGQSGNVSTPQLHFEIRKGTQAVDPGRYVAGL